MPRGKHNWTFNDVESFLKQHKFTLDHVKGSHYYFVAFRSGKFWMTHVQYHGSRSLHPKTLNSIIRQSGLSPEEWGI